MHGFQPLDGGVTAPGGYRACGIHVGIKARRPDMALVVSDRMAHVAGMFTTNAVQAAPVRLDRERVAAGLCRAVVINSGNANACTGEQGMHDARLMTDLVASGLSVETEHVLVCSTGVIGVPLPMDRVSTGIGQALKALKTDGGPDAARAIMTTDCRDKQAALGVTIGECPIIMAGMGKGAGMIEPNMATMLAVLTTDASVGADALRLALREAVDASFNRITVDGDCSTNDTVLLLANGAAGAPEIEPGSGDWDCFRAALGELCLSLARQIVSDGEGATKLVTVRVRGARSTADAERAARTVARSALVKTSWFGSDPNWGRVMAAVGQSGARIDEKRMRIAYDGVPAYEGAPVDDPSTRGRLERVLRQASFELEIDLGMEHASAVVYTCDLTLDYVRINADYTS